MKLTVKLPDREQNRLAAIATAMNAENQSEVVRMLINEKFESLQADKTLVERRGGHPQYLLDGTSSLSERTARKGAIKKNLIAKSIKRVR